VRLDAGTGLSGVSLAVGARAVERVTPAGEGDAEGAARSVSFTVRFDLAVVGLDEGFGDRQPDAGSAVPAIASGVGPIEAIEQPRQVFRGHPDAGVRDRDRQLVVRDRGGNADTTAWTGVA